EYDEFLLTKDGFVMLVFNYEGYLEFKEAYINEFNRMERELTLKKDSYMIEDPVERAKKWIAE
ncbi:MAG: Rha family transcriptional regulator, partial [Cetobacterium sp.]